MRKRTVLPYWPDIGKAQINFNAWSDDELVMLDMLVEIVSRAV